MYKSKNHSKYSLKVHLVFVVKYRKKLITPEIDFFLKTKLNQIADRSDFGVMDILLVQLEKMQAMRQSKSTLEIRDSRHSWSQLKTDTVSGKRGINLPTVYGRKHRRVS